MTNWSLWRWITASAGAVAAALIVGVPTGIVPTSFYQRMTPVLWVELSGVDRERDIEWIDTRDVCANAIQFCSTLARGHWQQCAGSVGRRLSGVQQIGDHDCRV